MGRQQWLAALVQHRSGACGVGWGGARRARRGSVALRQVRMFHCLQGELVKVLRVSDISVRCGFLNSVDANYCEGLICFHVVSQHG